MKQLQLMIRSKKFIINVIQDPCKSLKNISYYGLGVSPGKKALSSIQRYGNLWQSWMMVNILWHKSTTLFLRKNPSTFTMILNTWKFVKMKKHKLQSVFCNNSEI